MDSQPTRSIAGWGQYFFIDGFLDIIDDGFDLKGQSAAIGIAQHEKIRPAFYGGMQGFQSIVGVVYIAVEKMFGIIDNLKIVVF